MNEKEEAGSPRTGSERGTDLSDTAPVPASFVILIFAVAVAVAAVIAYLGFSGHLGAGIP
jgi:hypothetical protein